MINVSKIYICWYVNRLLWRFSKDIFWKKNILNYIAIFVKQFTLGADKHTYWFVLQYHCSTVFLVMMSNWNSLYKIDTISLQLQIFLNMKSCYFQLYCHLLVPILNEFKKKINKFCSKKIQNIYFASFQKRLFINQPYFFSI